jgi:hypothetical protein
LKHGATSCHLICPKSCNEDSQLTITSNAIKIDMVTYYHATNITQANVIWNMDNPIKKERQAFH